MFSEGPTKTFTASGALAIYRRVRLDGNGELAYAGAAHTDCIGITIRPAFAQGDKIGVWLLTSQGSFPVIAAAQTVARTLYAAADGKVDDSGTVLHGTALGPTGLAGAADDLLETIVSPAAIIGSTARTALVQDDLQPYPIRICEFRVWDAPSTVAPATPATDDLGVIDNTFLTAAPTVETGDLKDAGATTRKTRFQFAVPPEYVAGQTITLRANAGMKTTVASVSATIDFQAVRQAAPDADVCATDAQSINSLEADDFDFTITPTDVVPGDVLDCVCSVAVNDSGTGTAVIGQINSVALLLDVKG